MTDLALLAEEVGVSERTLRRAVDQGTLRASLSTPRTLQLSLAERGYIRRSWSLLSCLRTALRTEQNVRFALLFGSASTGTDTATGDVDVLVDLRDPSLERVVDLGAKLTKAVGRPTEIVRIQDALRETGFFADVVAEGRVLVDRDERWSGIRRQEAVLRRRAHQEDAERAQAALAGIDRMLAA